MNYFERLRQKYLHQYYVLIYIGIMANIPDYMFPGRIQDAIGHISLQNYE